MADFKFTAFSAKQKKVLTWWVDNSPHKDKDALIAEGAVRSGKTLIMSLSFVVWAMSTYSGKNFGMAGKTIGSFKRNVWILLKVMLLMRGYKIKKLQDTDSQNAYEIRMTKKINGVATTTKNNFFIFGGKDERSQDLVQGFTAGGFFFDEVTLMPESFVTQAVARCSVEGAKLWFNCNPAGPYHWFKLEWIDKADSKNALVLHFMLEDNPSLSAAVIERYKRMFSGVFYQRYILGLWVMAEGLIYGMYNHKRVLKSIPIGVKIHKKWIGVDYGQANATTFVLVGLGSDNVIYVMDVYYHSGNESSVQKSPKAYAKDFKNWLFKNGEEGMPVRYECIFIDPSAKGFMLQLHEEGIQGLRGAINEVNRGIELLASLMQADRVVVLQHCTDMIKELNSYSWDPKAQERGEDNPIKQNDHTLDALRYVANGVRQVFQKIAVLDRYSDAA